MVLRDVIVHSARASLLALTLGAGGARGCCSSCGDSPSGCSYMPPPEPPLVEPGAACGYLGWGSPRCREGECLNGVCSARPPAPTCGEYAQPCCDSDGGSVCNAPFWCVDGGVCGVCGDPGSPCCYDRPACRAGAICESRQCVACGREGEPCCGGACSGSLTCDGRVCVPIFPCGEVDEACCAGGTCNDAWCVRTTEGDVCRACGGAQTPCCEDDACALGLLCGDAGRCAPPPRVFRPCDEDGTCPGAACISPEAASAFEGQGDASVDAAADLGDAPPADDATDAADSDTGDAADGAPRGACYPCGTLDRPCCAGSRCAPSDTFSCDPAPPWGTPTCRLCGSIGAPCCPRMYGCHTGGHCETRAGDIARCVSNTSVPADAAADAR